ncbi:DnaJ domain-containing protein [Bradyrhizobium sp. Tv2a-2]|uniref:DnaJ domain-containing protein n=1 Tax=Bradyrhizobium sp. Tv2a-2 TaxID=113395 RepID=UPI0003F53F09|nr:DnaJ domain-containing protein [Bradyrhizobium sp. Tv2a-2]
MKTLYDLLGALPDDDAESLRAAFRKAVKANHPDTNPDDPDAPQRFRRIVRANAILRDERQRATYDQLLETALRQQGSKPRRAMFDTIRRAVLDTITGASLTMGVFGAGYLLLAPSPNILFAPAHVFAVSTPKSAPTAPAPSTGSSDTIGQASARDQPYEIAAPKAQANAESPKQTTQDAIASSEDAASAASSPNTPLVRYSETDDAKYYQERGISAYRSGDLFLALVDFDLAISHNPTASDAYIDRAIVYHRMGDLKHAFADIAEAKRIDSNRSKVSAAAASTP